MELDMSLQDGEMPWTPEPHTPLPWSEFCDGGDWWIQQCDQEGSPVGDKAICDANDMSASDMLYIVQACNAFPALVEALREAKSILWMAEKYAEGGGYRSIEMEDYTATVSVIDAALAQAGVTE